MSKSNMKTVLVAPGNTFGAAMESAGVSGKFFAAARRASDVRPQGREITPGCPTCTIESMFILRNAAGANMCRNCRREAGC